MFYSPEAYEKTIYILNFFLDNEFLYPMESLQSNWRYDDFD